MAELRNLLSRKMSIQAMDPLAQHMTTNSAEYFVLFSFASAYACGSFFVLRNQLSPIERAMDKLDMKLDMLSKEIKESNDMMNSRIDSVLLRSLDLQRSQKPAGE